MAIFESWKTGLSNCARIVSVNQLLSALEELKVRQPFI